MMTSVDGTNRSNSSRPSLNIDGQCSSIDDSPSSEVPFSPILRDGEHLFSPEELEKVRHDLCQDLILSLWAGN